MLTISFSHKFIFFHMTKTGGISVSTVLEKYSDSELYYLMGEKNISPFSKKIISIIKEDMKFCTSYKELSLTSRIFIKYINCFLFNFHDKIPKRFLVGRLYSNPSRFVEQYDCFINNVYPKFPNNVEDRFHTKPIELKESMPETFNNSFKFSFVRNPYTWLVSVYHYFSQAKYLPQFYKYFKKFNSFDDFVDHVVQIEDIDELNFLRLPVNNPQKNFIYDNNDKPLVDYVGKIENIQQDLNKISDIIGIERIKLPWHNKSKHDTYEKYYNSRTKEKVYSLFREDFEIFGYKK